MIIELDLKPLLINFPSSLVYQQKINLNDDLQIDVDYEGNPDDYTLSLALLYKLEVVATKKQSFTSFSFQIWDLFSDFERDSNEVILRVTLYDPRFLMPSLTNTIVRVNFPPIGGSVEVFPSEGYSLETEFLIRASNFQDEDSPLSYRFFYYWFEGLYEEERKLGANPLGARREFLGDSGVSNELAVRLPLGKQSEQMRVLVMVSVRDSLGSVTNSTREVRVDARYRSSLER